MMPFYNFYLFSYYMPHANFKLDLEKSHMKIELGKQKYI